MVGIGTEIATIGIAAIVKDVMDGITPCKGVLKDKSHRFPQIQGVETGTVAEGPVANHGHSIRNRQGSQTATTFESHISDSGNGWSDIDRG